MLKRENIFGNKFKLGRNTKEGIGIWNFSNLIKLLQSNFIDHLHTTTHLNQSVVQLLETKELILIISCCAFTGVILMEAEQISCKNLVGNKSQGKCLASGKDTLLEDFYNTVQ